MKYLKKYESSIENIENIENIQERILYLSKFNGRNMIFNQDGYKLFFIESFDEISGFDSRSAMCRNKILFENYNEKGRIHFLY